MSDALPTVVQLWFKKPQQVPAYLNSLSAVRDSVGFNPSVQPGIEVVPKLRHIRVDVGSLHDQLLARGLTLTHASRLKRQTFAADQFSREYELIRFHYFPSDVARVHDGVDTQKLVNAFREIAAMGFFNLNVHINPSPTGQWMSINLDGRTQRYIGEDLTKPVLVKKSASGEKLATPRPIMPARKLQFEGNLLELV